LHFAVAPVGSVLPVDDLVVAAVDFEAGVLGAVVVGAVDFIMVPLGGALEAGGAAAGADEEPVLPDEVAFCTPPWPLHAPRPVALEVVPSLQVVGVAAACAPAVCVARLESARIRDGTINRTRGKVFIGFAPRVVYDSGCRAAA
jgi:hypothetical protein